MKIIFEIDKNDTKTIEEIRNDIDIIEEEQEDGLDSNDIVALVAALVPTAIGVIERFLSLPTVTIKVTTKENQVIEISSVSAKKAIKQLRALCDEMGWK